MDFNTVLQRRYSCRKFLAQAVEPEKIDRILEAGRIAPTALNKQPLHLVVGCHPADVWVRRYDGKNGARSMHPSLQHT